MDIRCCRATDTCCGNLLFFFPRPKTDDLYVRRAKSVWVKDGQKSSAPKILKRFESSIKTETFGLVLGRYRNQLLLLITGLEAKKNNGDLQPVVHNDIAIVLQSSDEADKVLRGIAARALRDKGAFEDLVAEKVVSNREPGVGFTVNKSLYSQLKDLSTASWEPDTPEHREDVAKKLDSSQLPKENGPLVVITGGSSQPEGVWLGLFKPNQP